MKKKVLKEVDGRLIKEDNKLIQSTANMTPMSQKLFEISVAAIDPNSEDSNTVRVDKELIFKSLDITGKNRNNRLTAALERLVDDASFSYTEIENKSQIDVKIKPVYRIQNNHSFAYSEISFAPDIMPLLVELHNKFTKYPLSDILKMKGKYSIPIYRWLMLGFNQYEYYSGGNNRTRDQLNEYLNPRISVDELRKITGTVQKYNDWRNFKKYVLDLPMREINEHSERISFEWQPIRAGRRITDIQFKITKKLIKDDKENVDDLYVKYANDVYTLKLIANGILSPVDVSKKDLILALGENLYPHYREFEKKHGVDMLDKHISYLSKNKPDKFLKPDLYLKKAFDNYTVKLANGTTKKVKKVKEVVPDWDTDGGKKYTEEERRQLNKEIDDLFKELEKN